MQLVVDPLSERNGARGADHAVVEEGLYQRRADQVSLPGGGGPAAGPVREVEVVERAERSAGQRRGGRTEAGQVRGGRGGTEQSQAARGQAAEQLSRRQVTPGPRAAEARAPPRARAPPAAEGPRAAPAMSWRSGAPGRLRIPAAQQFAAMTPGLHRLCRYRRIGAAHVLERRQHPV